MVDFILFCFCIGLFVAGFWCGKTYASFGQMIDGLTAKVKGWFA